MKRAVSSIFVSLVIAVLAPVAPAGATTEEVQNALYEAFIGEMFENQEATLQARQNLADAALAYWRNFNERLPELTEDEKALVAERDAFVFTLDPVHESRFYELANSRAVNLDRLRNETRRCVGDHEALATAIGTDAETEAVAWLGVVHCYFNARYSHWLTRAELNSGGVAGDYKMQYFGLMLDVISNKIAPALVTR